MTGKNIGIFGLYSTYAYVENAIRVLKAAGFRNTDISVLMPQNVGSKDLAASKSAKAPEGAAAGAVSSVVVDGTLAWLAAVGALAVPGVGPLLVAGPIVSALAGVGTVGAAGGIADALIGMGIPEYEARRYEGRIRSGGILLSVHCDDAGWPKRAKEILKITGASEISKAGGTGADFARADRPLLRGDTGGNV